MPSMSPAARALLDHPEDCCRWPLGDGWCTRKAVDGKAYCAAHHAESRAHEQRDYHPLTINRMIQWRPQQTGRWKRRAA